MANVCLLPWRLWAGRQRTSVMAMPAGQGLVKGAPVLIAPFTVNGKKASFRCIQPGDTLARRRVDLETFTAAAKLPVWAELFGYRSRRPRDEPPCASAVRKGMSQISVEMALSKKDP